MMTTQERDPEDFDVLVPAKVLARWEKRVSDLGHEDLAEELWTVLMENDTLSHDIADGVRLHHGTEVPPIKSAT